MKKNQALIVAINITDMRQLYNWGITYGNFSLKLVSRGFLNIYIFVTNENILLLKKEFDNKFKYFTKIRTLCL